MSLEFGLQTLKSTVFKCDHFFLLIPVAVLEKLLWKEKKKISQVVDTMGDLGQW